MITGKFAHGTHSVPMTLGYVLAHGAIFDRGLDILSITKDNSVIQIIMLDDSTMLKVWYYYVEQATGQSFDEALEILDENPKGLEPFRKAFWELVVGFMPTALQPTLKGMWREAEKQLRNAQEKTSTTSISPSSDEPE